MARQRQGTVHPFTLSQTSQLSAAFGEQTDRVRVTVGSTTTFGGAYVLFGDSTSITVSSTNGSLVGMNNPQEFDVTRGQRVAVIAASTASLGLMTVTELI